MFLENKIIKNKLPKKREDRMKGRRGVVLGRGILLCKAERLKEDILREQNMLKTVKHSL